jgi:23S rRNA G2069 N7-methylase RlmK/C1962 C5-methylase RlmI
MELMITFKQYITENNKIITSADQYGDPGMKRITDLLLKKNNGKVDRDFLDWIKSNFLTVFNWNDAEYEQLTGTIDDMFNEVVLVRWENDDSNDDDSDEEFERQGYQVLDILKEAYQKDAVGRKQKRVKDIISKKDKSGWEL